MKRYSVLTFIFNDYEPVREIKEKSPDADFILVTDNPSLTSETWTVLYDPKLSGLSVFEKCYQVRNLSEVEKAQYPGRYAYARNNSALYV